MSRRRKRLVWCALVAACLAVLFTSDDCLAQSGATNALTASEQEEFDRGLAAARNQQWSTAIAAFWSVVEPIQRGKSLLHSAQYAPVYFNIGLAYEKDNRPIEAAAFLQAYLVLAPAASNQAAVRHEVASLETKGRSQIYAVFKQAEQLASHLSRFDRGQSLLFLAKAYAAMGDFDNARRLVPAISQVYGYGRRDLMPQFWNRYLWEVAGRGYHRKARLMLAEAEKKYPSPPHSDAYKDARELIGNRCIAENQCSDDNNIWQTLRFIGWRQRIGDEVAPISEVNGGTIVLRLADIADHHGTYEWLPYRLFKEQLTKK